VTEVSDIDAIIEQAEEAERLYTINHSSSTPLSINLDTNSSSSVIAAEEWREQQKIEEALHASSLQVPRRPPWTPEMSVEELDANEKQAFLNWRRMLVRLAFFVLPHLNFTSSVCYKQINICHQIVCW
jgi:large subunit GTPase 1